LERAHESLERPFDDATIGTLAHALREARVRPDVQEAIRIEDHSADHFRSASLLWFETAGLDADLAEALLAMSSDPRTHPPYPESRAVLTELHEDAVRIAVVSDFSFDFRPAMNDHGFAEFVDAVVISFEHGFQKPDPRMFTTALSLLDVGPGEALMVGDRASHDGAAASVGIDTLILPMPSEVSHPGLDAVKRIVGTVDRRSDEAWPRRSGASSVQSTDPSERPVRDGVNSQALDGGTPPSGHASRNPRG
jgi:HAD superfamily hydrolase (TIGR01509 family)